MKRAILALVLVLTLATGVYASTIPAFLIPEGKTEVWVPVIWDAEFEPEPCYRVNIPDGIDWIGANWDVTEPDKTRPNYGHQIIKYSSVFVAPEDVDLVTTKIAEADVPIADRMIVEIARAGLMSGKEESDRVAASTRCMNFFSTHADLWAQDKYKELGRTCLRVAGRRLAPGTITALKELYNL